MPRRGDAMPDSHQRRQEKGDKTLSSLTALFVVEYEC